MTRHVNLLSVKDNRSKTRLKERKRRRRRVQDAVLVFYRWNNSSSTLLRRLLERTNSRRTRTEGREEKIKSRPNKRKVKRAKLELGLNSWM